MSEDQPLPDCYELGVRGCKMCFGLDVECQTCDAARPPDKKPYMNDK